MILAIECMPQAYMCIEVEYYCLCPSGYIFADVYLFVSKIASTIWMLLIDIFRKCWSWDKEQMMKLGDVLVYHLDTGIFKQLNKERNTQPDKQSKTQQQQTKEHMILKCTHKSALKVTVQRYHLLVQKSCSWKVLAPSEGLPRNTTMEFWS